MGQEYIWNLIARKLSGEASEKEKQELESLLRSKPDMHYPMQTVIDLWNSEQQDNKEDASRAFGKHIKRMDDLKIGFRANPSFSDRPGQNKNIFKAGQSKSFARWGGLTLLFLTGTLLPLFFFFGPISHHQPKLQKTKSEISTKNGSRTNLILPDGTLVWLNAGSKLSYDKNYGNSLREINLSGEAFFEVVKNSEKPFIIHTNRIDIKVLGTRFDVKSYPSDRTTEATLIRGSIEVTFRDRPSQKIILRPNEKIVVADEGTASSNSAQVLSKSRIEPFVAIRKPAYDSVNGSIIETSWMENKLIFHDETFSNLAEEMERWYGVAIHFDDPVQKELRFTGSFKNETIQQALNALKLSEQFNYVIKENQINIFQ